MFRFTILLCIYSFFVITNANAQTTPLALDTSISISKVLDVSVTLATRLDVDPVTGHLHYSGLFGDIYKVFQPDSTAAYDNLVFSSSDHMIPNVQGLCFIDSALYISGNSNIDAGKMRTGIIAKGVLQSNGTRAWTKVAETEKFTTHTFFNHLFTSLIPTPTGDTLLWSCGSRGDHGEIDSNFGAFPNRRSDPLNGKILKIPANANNLVVPNDTVLLQNMGFVLADGFRNNYDMAYNAKGELFGVENAGDRDMEEELNWIRQGHHYGWPWYMGNELNPSQFPAYDASIDPLVNQTSYAYTSGLFAMDPSFPAPPGGLQFTVPCANEGPDADFYRDSLSGNVIDATSMGVLKYVYSFTGHRSPLGLTFDKDSVLGGNFRGMGFVCSYTRGDSTLPGNSNLMAPMGDKSEDLLMLDLRKNVANDNYILSATKVVEKLNSPVDAVLVRNKMYILETGSVPGPAIWVLEFPDFCSTISNPVNVTTTKKNLQCNNVNQGEATAFASGGEAPYSYEWNTNPVQTTQAITNLAGNTYTVNVADQNGCTASKEVNIFNPTSLSSFVIVTHSNPAGTATGTVNQLVTGGIAPYSYNWSNGATTEDIDNLVPGFYFVQTSDRNGCAKVVVVTVN